jgi:hypothetical protein
MSTRGESAPLLADAFGNGAKQFQAKAKSFGQEFKAFVLKGNVFDLAIAVILGAAFQAVVSSFAADIIQPPIGLMIGR